MHAVCDEAGQCAAAELVVAVPVREPAAGTAAADVLSNDTDTEDGINPWSLRIVAPAALGEAAPDHRRVLAAVIYEAAAAAGYDTMIYERL